MYMIFASLLTEDSMRIIASSINAVLPDPVGAGETNIDKHFCETNTAFACLPEMTMLVSVYRAYI